MSWMLVPGLLLIVLVAAAVRQAWHLWAALPKRNADFGLVLTAADLSMEPAARALAANEPVFLRRPAAPRAEPRAAQPAAQSAAQSAAQPAALPADLRGQPS